MDLSATVTSILLSILFAALGFALLFGGCKLFDALTPTNLGKRIFEDGNMAAAILAGAFVIAMSIVVSAAIA